MKKRLALVRGPNLNAWEMQSFTPLLDTFEIVGFTSYGHNFDVHAIPFQVRRLFSFGQFLRPRRVNRARETLILEGVPEQKIRVQMPGIDLRRFRPTAKDDQILRQLRCGANDAIILFVAKLHREKGVIDLLYAFRRAVGRLGKEVKLKLLLAGKGREEARILESIRRLQLDDYAQLIGSFPYSSMPQLHNIADIFVLPSIPTPKWQEQLGCVLVESMAYGKTVISTLSGAIPEVVADAGVLVPADDFLSLANALEALISDEKKRAELGQKGRRRAEEVLSWRKRFTRKALKP